jgi:DNA-binding MarR family transcriptional regulator
LIDEQVKILKFMNEMTGHIDGKDFAKKTGLTASQIAEHMQVLAKDGFLKRVGAGYSLTEKGKAALKAASPVAWNMRFNFYTGIGQPTGVSAGSVKEFRDLASSVNSVSLEFHLYRGDFENWVRSAVGDAAFADELAKIRKTELKGEELRKSLLKAAEERYGS